jgi:hypothetical protein
LAFDKAVVKNLGKLEARMNEEGKAFLMSMGEYLVRLCDEEDSEKKLKFYSYFFKPKEFFKEQIESEVTERVESVREETEQLLKNSRKKNINSNKVGVS